MEAASEQREEQLQRLLQQPVQPKRAQPVQQHKPKPQPKPARQHKPAQPVQQQHKPTKWEREKQRQRKLETERLLKRRRKPGMAYGAGYMEAWATERRGANARRRGR